MGDVGLWELAVIGVVGLLVFGPERLPELATKAARGLARLRAHASEAMEELRQAADLGEVEQEFKGLSADMQAMRNAARNPLRAALAAAARPRDDDAPPPVDMDAT